MKVNRLVALCLAAPAIIAVVYCGGSSSSTPSNPNPNPVPTAATPAPEPTFAPLACDPTPPPLHGIKVKIHSHSGFRKIMDSRPLVEDVDGYCKATGQSGKFCFARPEGDPQQADCDRMAMGISPDTGRYGPTWAFDGMPCSDEGSPEPGCYHHPDNQFLAIAKGDGIVSACASPDVPIGDGSCGGCRITRSSPKCQ